MGLFVRPFKKSHNRIRSAHKRYRVGRVETGIQGGVGGVNSARTTLESIMVKKRMNVQAKPEMKKRAWTPEEDKRLVKLVKRYGAEQWPVIAKEMKTRTERQCRDHWNISLRPDIRHGAWTAEEDSILIDAHGRLGDKWSASPVDRRRRCHIRPSPRKQQPLLRRG